MSIPLTSYCLCLQNISRIISLFPFPCNTFVVQTTIMSCWENSKSLLMVLSTIAFSPSILHSEARETHLKLKSDPIMPLFQTLHFTKTNSKVLIMDHKSLRDQLQATSSLTFSLAYSSCFCHTGLATSGMVQARSLFRDCSKATWITYSLTSSRRLSKCPQTQRPSLCI